MRWKKDGARKKNCMRVCYSFPFFLFLSSSSCRDCSQHSLGLLEVSERRQQRKKGTGATLLKRKNFRLSVCVFVSFRSSFSSFLILSRLFTAFWGYCLRDGRNERT